MTDFYKIKKMKSILFLSYLFMFSSCIDRKDRVEIARFVFVDNDTKVTAKNFDEIYIEAQKSNAIVSSEDDLVAKIRFIKPHHITSLTGQWLVIQDENYRTFTAVVERNSKRHLEKEKEFLFDFYISHEKPTLGKFDKFYFKDIPVFFISNGHRSKDYHLKWTSEKTAEFILKK